MNMQHEFAKGPDYEIKVLVRSAVLHGCLQGIFGSEWYEVVSTRYSGENREKARRGIRDEEQNWYCDVLHAAVCNAFFEKEDSEEKEVMTQQSASLTTES